jgi:type I restriction enzyme S subunit
MMLPKYSEYKKTHVDWLGEIPAHWSIKSCRGVLADRNERNEPLINQNYLSLMANIGIMLYEEKGDVGNKKPDDLGKCKQVYPGDLVINSMNYGIGSYGLSKHRGVCSPVYIVLKPKLNEVEERYIFRILEIKKFQQYAQSFGNGILEHRASISWDILKNIGLPIPPIKEQEVIVQFLDHEVDKIDKLISEQEKLISTLNEKSERVISNAVTKGLNPKVKMKETGIEWLGNIPDHWKLGKIKFACETSSGGTPDTSKQELYYTDESGIPWVRTTDLSNSELSNVEIFITEKALNDTACKILPEGTVLVAMYGGDGTVGKNGLLKIKAAINQALCGIRPYKNNLVAEYLFKYIQFYRPYWMIKAESSRKDPNISQELVKNAPLITPPFDEQLKIVKYLIELEDAFSKLKSKAEKLISLLHERRVALISAAVTGQIDVRNYQLKESA